MNTFIYLPHTGSLAGRKFEIEVDSDYMKKISEKEKPEDVTVLPRKIPEEHCYLITEGDVEIKELSRIPILSKFGIPEPKEIDYEDPLFMEVAESFVRQMHENPNARSIIHRGGYVDPEGIYFDNDTCMSHTFAALYKSIADAERVVGIIPGGVKHVWGRIKKGYFKVNYIHFGNGESLGEFITKEIERGARVNLSAPSRLSIDNYPVQSHPKYKVIGKTTSNGDFSIQVKKINPVYRFFDIRLSARAFGGNVEGDSAEKHVKRLEELLDISSKDGCITIPYDKIQDAMVILRGDGEDEEWDGCISVRNIKSIVRGEDEIEWDRDFAFDIKGDPPVEKVRRSFRDKEEILSDKDEDGSYFVTLIREGFGKLKLSSHSEGARCRLKEYDYNLLKVTGRDEDVRAVLENINNFAGFILDSRIVWKK